MLCKKCGTDIADTSKFCGYCGNPVEVTSEQITNTNSTEIPVNPVEVPNEHVDSQINIVDSPENIVENLTNNVDLGKTIKIEPVQPESVNVPEQSEVQNVSETLASETVANDPVMNNSVNESVINNQINQVDLNNTGSYQQAPVNNQVVQNNANTTNNKNNKLIFIIGGIALAVIAIIVVAFTFINSSNTPISVLKKALANLEERGENSATVDAKVSFATSTGESFSFSATVKSEKKSDDSMDMQITVNKSLFFEEMNVYTSMDDKNATMYMESSLIDMLGMTYSLTPTWVYYKVALDEIVDEQTEEATEETIEEIDLEDIIDQKHFVYVDEANDLRHYELIIDQQLIDTIKVKLANINIQEVKDMFNSIETLEKPIKIDFYITKSNELSKIELDMTEHLIGTDGMTSDISSFVIGMEFRNLNNTKVEIPNDAKNSVTDLDTYMTLNSNMDYSYDTAIDSNLNNTIYGF